MEDLSTPDSPVNPHAPSIDIPAKPPGEEPRSAINIWLRSITSLALYLIIGFYIFQSFEMLLLITAIVVLHEMGHFLAMKSFRYKDLGIFFIPLLGAYVSGSKREVSQRESAIILLAGPLPGIIIGIIVLLVDRSVPGIYLGSLGLESVSLLLVFLNLLNLLPVYPLDGGQLLNRVFLDEEGWVSRIFVFISAAFLVWFALFATERPFYILLIFPAMMLLRLVGDSRLDAVEKKLEAAGIDLDRSYEDLSDHDYWNMRNILIENHAGFRDVQIAPPYVFDAREEKIMTTIQSLLHRNLVQDVSWPGKVFILLVWVAAIASPWLLNMNMSFFHHFGF